MPRELRLLAVALVTAALALGVGHCAGREQATQDAATQVALANGQRLARAFHVRYDSVRALEARAAAVRVREAQARRRAVAAEGALADVLALADTTLADTAASRDTLRARLAQVTRESHTHLAVAQGYREAAAERAAADAAVIEAARAALDTATATIAEKDTAIARLRRAQRCRVLGVLPCPTRTQSFLGGGGLALLLLLL